MCGAEVSMEILEGRNAVFLGNTAGNKQRWRTGLVIRTATKKTIESRVAQALKATSGDSVQRVSHWDFTDSSLLTFILALL